MNGMLTKFIFSITEKVLFRRTPVLYRWVYSIYKSITDRAERNLCRSLIHPGMIVADVGANIGIYTDFFRKLVGSGGEVHAFEPEPTNFRLLSNALSSYDNIFLNQSGVGGGNENIFLYISQSLNVDHRTYKCSEERDRVLVDCIALDDYFNNDKSVDFIKIDIQGYEYHALSGMRRVLEDNNQLKILAEYFPYGLEATGYSGSKLRTFLMERGFLLYSVTNRGNLLALREREPRLNSLGYTNIFAQRC